MANRQLLALSKLDEFAAWAASHGFQREPTKGTFEVLRLRVPSQPPVLFFARNRTLSGGTPQHATAQREGEKLVHRWLRARNEKQEGL